MRVKNQIDTFAVSNYNSAINQNDTQKDGGTFVISILEEAMTHIDELEIENEELRAEIERLKARNLGGRKNGLMRHGWLLIRNLQLSMKRV